MQRATIRNRFTQPLLVAFLVLAAATASAAPKTDTVIFKNGDKLTGEVKSLYRGQLSLSTDATGTIGIEWAKIASVVSAQRVQVEVSSGTRYFGNLASAETDSSIVVVTDGGPQIIETGRVVSMTPIEDRGIHALEVDLSLGFDYAKAGGVQHSTFGIDMDYRSLIRIESIRFSTVLTNSSGQDASNRTNLGFRHTRLWKNRWFSNGSLTFDQNDELGLNLRTSIGAGGGRYLIQSNSMLLSLDGGLQLSRENQIAEDEDTDSLEAVFTADWDWFLFDDPDLDWSTSLQVIPSLTESGRVRGEFDTALSWEIIGDLKWKLSFYGSWDNQPHSSVGSTSDYGVNTAVAYEF